MKESLKINQMSLGQENINKVITVHSKKSGAESDFNTRLLLGVEQADMQQKISYRKMGEKRFWTQWSLLQN